MCLALIKRNLAKDKVSPKVTISEYNPAFSDNFQISHLFSAESDIWEL